jgi:hypothetical protein
VWSGSTTAGARKPVERSFLSAKSAYSPGKTCASSYESNSGLLPENKAVGFWQGGRLRRPNAFQAVQTPPIGRAVRQKSGLINQSIAK